MILVLSIIGFCIWLFGLALIIACIFMPHPTFNIFERLSGAGIGFVIFGLLGLCFLIPGISTPMFNVKIDHQQPTSIIKTNNLTIVSYVENNRCIINGNVFYSAEAWNSTNITIQIDSGDNIFFRKVKNHKVKIVE